MNLGLWTVLPCPSHPSATLKTTWLELHCLGFTSFPGSVGPSHQWTCITWKWWECISDVLASLPGDTGCQGKCPTHPELAWVCVSWECICITSGWCQVCWGSAWHHPEGAWTSYIWGVRLGVRFGFGSRTIWFETLELAFPSLCPSLIFIIFPNFILFWHSRQHTQVPRRSPEPVYIFHLLSIPVVWNELCTSINLRMQVYSKIPFVSVMFLLFKMCKICLLIKGKPL